MDVAAGGLGDDARWPVARSGSVLDTERLKILLDHLNDEVQRAEMWVVDKLFTAWRPRCGGLSERDAEPARFSRGC